MSQNKTIALIVAVLALYGGSHYVMSRLAARYPQSDPATLEKSNRVKPGMTVTQVEAIFGAPGFVPKGDSPTSPRSISWTNRNWSGVGVIFDNGRVIQVVRSGDLPQESGE